MIVLSFCVLLAGASLFHVAMSRRARLQPVRIVPRSGAYRER